jgi:hypothetical protein
MKSRSYASLNDELVGSIIKMISEGNPDGMQAYLEVHLFLESNPGWYINEMLLRIYHVIKEEHSKTILIKKKKHLTSAMELLYNNYSQLIWSK